VAERERFLAKQKNISGKCETNKKQTRTVLRELNSTVATPRGYWNQGKQMDNNFGVIKYKITKIF
jgi:hypothetical protein